MVKTSVYLDDEQKHDPEHEVNRRHWVIVAAMNSAEPEHASCRQKLESASAAVISPLVVAEVHYLHASGANPAHSISPTGTATSSSCHRTLTRLASEPAPPHRFRTASRASRATCRERQDSTESRSTPSTRSMRCSRS